MKRLILCPVVAMSLLVFLTSCSGDPTGDLRGGVEKLNPNPSQVFLQQGKTTKVDVTATDAQGNQIETAFALTSQGPGISVVRDNSFRAVYANDTLLVPPATDAIFRYQVTATDLVASSFTISAEGKDVVVPVNVMTATGAVPAATVTSTGTPVNTPTVLAIPAPYQFPAGATATFDAGAGLVIDRAADGSTLTVLAPPGTTSPGTVTVVLNYLPTIPDSTVTATPVTTDATVPSMAGTGSPATAPDIAVPPVGGTTAFFDAATFGAGVFGADRVYKITLTEAADITATVNWDNDSDIDVALCSDAACANAPDFTAATGDQPESTTYSLQPGTYFLIVNLFAPGTAGPPAWISIQLQR